MFLSVGKVKDICKLYESLVLASKEDIFMMKKNHSSGWGYFIASNERSYYYRSSKPIYEDEWTLYHYLQDEATYYAMFHSRLASQREPTRGFIDSHPFIVRGDERLIIVAHNGSINKHLVAKELGIPPELYTDSEILAILLSSYKTINIKDRLEKAKETIKRLGAFTGALNVMAIEISYNAAPHVSIACLSDFPLEKEGLYYKMVMYKGDDRYEFMSSTVAFYNKYIDSEGNILDNHASYCERGRIYP